MESGTLETRLGPLAWQSSGHGPELIFFAGAIANHDLWRDVIAALQDRYRCITVDLPLGAHSQPLRDGADRSAPSLARLLLDCLDLLGAEDATVVANDTAGGLVLLSLTSGHPALGRIGRLVLTNCDNYDQFPPDSLRKASALCRALPGLARVLTRQQLRSAAGRRRLAAGACAAGLDDARAESFFGPGRRDPRVAGDLVAAMAGCRPQLLVEAASAFPRFGQPVLLVWGDRCDFFPMAHAQRLATQFPHATLVPVPGAKTWVPVDNPAVLAGAISDFVPVPAA
jgi:pimeloyl-ACP methyl ester carboxylesterase